MSRVLDFVEINLKMLNVNSSKFVRKVNLKSQVKEKAESLCRNDGRLMGVSLIPIIRVRKPINA